MSGAQRRQRVILGVALGALALAALSAPPDVAPWFIASGALALVGVWVSAWYDRRGPRAVVRGLVATWAELPGAVVEGDGVLVHDGMQPLVVRLGRQGDVLHAIIQTPGHEAPMAWRVWPRDQQAPGMGRDGASLGGPPVTRRHEVEQRVGGTLRVDASDTEATFALDSDLLGAVLSTMRDHPRAFGGLTYDGQRISVHLSGPLVTDPPRAAAVARRLWTPLVD